jgi:hypothetical protein
MLILFPIVILLTDRLPLSNNPPSPSSIDIILFILLKRFWEVLNISIYFLENILFRKKYNKNLTENKGGGRRGREMVAALAAIPLYANLGSPTLDTPEIQN